MTSRLGVLVDGAALPEAEARAFWTRFSAHLDAHKGDLAGFAKAEGFASVHPETRDGRPVLVASRTEPQRPYTNAPNRREAAAGSKRHQGKPAAPAGGGSRAEKGRKSRG